MTCLHSTLVLLTFLFETVPVFHYITCLVVVFLTSKLNQNIIVSFHEIYLKKDFKRSVILSGYTWIPTTALQYLKLFLIFIFCWIKSVVICRVGCFTSSVSQFLHHALQHNNNQGELFIRSRESNLGRQHISCEWCAPKLVNWQNVLIYHPYQYIFQQFK